MKHIARSLAIATAVIVGSPAFAQDWRNALEDPNANFYDIQTNFYAEWGVREQQNNQARQDNTLLNDKWPQNDPANPVAAPFMKGGYKQFKRWEYYMEPRVYPSGDITLPSSNYERFCDYLDNTPDAMAQYYATYGQYPIRNGNTLNQRSGPPPVNPMSSTWTFMGPTGYPANGGAGRINVIRFDPTNSSIMYAGAPAGGLWKSTNGGTTWAIVASTDQIASIGITDIAIDPTNNQIIYIATGDGDAGDTYSVGVLKSTDGGLTWATTGLSWTPNQGRTISRLLIHPTNSQILMAFTNNGIYRTTTGGTGAWTQVQNTNAFRDGEFQPGNPSVVYGAGTRFWKSTDGGVTWTNTATGLPANTAVDRFSIAVTAANTNYVYILAGSAANNGFYGVYRSTNAGGAFTQRSSTPNLMGWSSTGADTGGQSWYDHGFDVAPGNADHVMVGGVNHWRSINGGTSWTLNAHWTGTGAPYVHADVHCIIYAPTAGNTTRYFSGNDGGINETTNSGGAWSDRSAQLCIAQPYRIGLSASTANLWLTGHQDNGTNRFNGSWAEVMGGDGMDCFIDRTNNNNMYGEQYNGAFNRSTNGGGTWGGYTTGLTGAAGWVTPWIQDPTNALYLWAGYTQVFRRNTSTGNWTQMGTITGSGTIVDVKVAPSNGAYVYAARSTSLWRSTNTGGTWTNITGTLPVASAAISRICIDPLDANNVWVTFSGYSAANKIFVTTNGGTSWTNITTGLPNMPANCVVYTPGSTNDAIYVGMDIGVYYRDNTTGAWAPYFTGLPNVPIYDLEIYAPTSKVRCASFGRGVWEVDIYNPGTLAPVADFSANQTVICAGTPVNFTDLSSFTPTSWSWSFQGGTPATSTAQNPTGITWSTPGSYSVTLTATNANGSDAETKTAYITVMPTAVAPPLTEGFTLATFLPANWTANNANNDGIYWDRSATVGVAPTAGNSARFDNYNLDAAGARDEMICPPQTFASMSTCSLTFDVAYARYNATYSDTLEVMVSTNCGSTWTQVWIKGGATLATAPDNTAQFVPTAAQWRNENINLNTYCGQSSILIKFVNHGRYGNCLYVDNVNIAGTAAALPNGTFTASTTTVCAGTPVDFTSTSSGAPTSWTWTFPSGTPASATTQNVTGVVWNTAGTYTITHTATNINGTGTTTQVITVLATPTVTATSGTTTLCAGQSTTLTGGGASTYVWNPGAIPGSPVTVTPASTTTYTVTGTAANGCTSTATRTITVNPLPTVTASTSTTTICSGNSATLTATGASTYNWMPGSLPGTPVTVSPGTTTTYTVTGTAVTGCANTATVTVNVNASPTVTASSSTTTICSGQSATLTGSGASTYVWNPGAIPGSPVTVSPVTTTTYTVTGTAANGCTSTATRTITVNASPTVTATSSTTTICAGSSVTLTGSGASTYNWNPGSIPGSPITVSPATTTTYTVTGTAANGCTSTATQMITVNASPTVTASSSTTTICNSGSVTLSATGASTYNWMPGSLPGTPVTVSPATTTTYTVTGTAANGCTATATQMITVSPTPTVTVTTSSATICSGQSSTITASGATTYSWLPGPLTGGTVTVTPGTTTTYTVTGTTGGCSSNATQVITVNASPTVTASSSTTTICSGGSATLTATGASTYNWMPGSLPGTPVTVTPGSTTTYTVTGTAANGCTGSSTQLITVTPTPTVSVTASTTTLCTGQSATLTASGATTYSWLPGPLSGGTVTVTPGATTTYTVTGTTSGCSSSATQLITVNATPTVTATSSTTTICSGNSVTLTGGGASSYSWMPGPIAGSPITVSPAATTTYTVTGTAANGCTATATRTITVNASPTVTVSASTTSICTGGSTTLTGGGASTYNWLPGPISGSPVTVTPASTTTYTVTGTAVNGCTGMQTILISVGASPTVTATASNNSICQGASTTLTGAGATTFTWMPGSLSGGTVTVTPTVTTTYTVTGSNGPGCSNTSTVLVTVNTVPVVTASSSTTTVCSGSPVTCTGSGASTYNWMPGNVNGTVVTFNPTSNTTYTVTGTSANGCTDAYTFSISVNALPNLTVTPSSTAICIGGSTTLSASPTTGPVSFSWSPTAGLGSPTASSTTASPTITTTYVCTKMINTTGCTRQDTAIVIVNSGPTMTLSAAPASICTGGSTTLSGTGAVTYNWNPGNLNGSSVSVTPAVTTTYTATGTGSTGCTSTQTISVTVGPAPTVTASSSSPSVCIGSSATLTANGAAAYTWMPGAMSGSSVVVSPTVATTYTVTGDNGPGCSGTTTITVGVNALPSVTASASSPSVCVGSNVTLTGSGASTYTWMPGSMSGSTVTDAPSSATTYTVTGTDVNGCSNTSTVAVGVNTLPTVTASASAPSVCIGDNVTLTGSGASTYNWMPGSLSGSTVTDAPSSATTYTVTGTDGNGCSNTSTIAVGVNTLPTVTASSSSSNLCQGDPVTLTASGATNYSWMPGSLSGSPVTDNPASSTTYTVTGTDGNGCTGSSTISVNVTSLPNVTLTLTNDTFCAADGALPLSGGSPAGGTYSGPGVAGGMFDASSVGVGTYTVTYSYTDTTGCSNTASQQVVVDICNGMNTPSSVLTVMHIVPNPNNGEFMLTFDIAKADDYVLEIHNTLGQIVYSEQLNTFSGTYSNKIDLREYGRGAYTIRLRSTHNEVVERVITF